MDIFRNEKLANDLLYYYDKSANGTATTSTHFPIWQTSFGVCFFGHFHDSLLSDKNLFLAKLIS